MQKLFLTFFLVFCSHARSHKYYVRSIYDNKILTSKCNSFMAFSNGGCNSNKTTFGAWSSQKLSGNYYLTIAVPTEKN